MMHVQDTITCFYPLVILQCFLGINRLHILTSNVRVNIFCKYIFPFVKLGYIFLIFFDGFIAAQESRNIYLILFQISIGTLWLYLLFFPNTSKKFFDVLLQLDQKCFTSSADDYYIKISGEVQKVTLLSSCFIVCHFFVASLLRLDKSLIYIICIGVSAFETELCFYGLLINCFNLRLAKLKTLGAVNGAKINRYILITTSQMIGTFSKEVFVLLAGTLITTYISIIVVFLADPLGLPSLLSYLVWAITKDILLLFYVCGSAVKTEAIYKELTFDVAKRITAHIAMRTGEKSYEFKLLKRWYRFLVSDRPRFSAGSCVDLDLGVPLHMTEVIVSYILLFIQFYTAYFMY